MIENNGTVLGSHIRSLPIKRSWVVVRPKNVEQLLVADFGRIELQFNNLSVPGSIGADLFVTRFFLRPTGITNRSGSYAFQITECLLDTPKAAGTERGFFCLHRVRWNDERGCATGGEIPRPPARNEGLRRR